MPEYTQKTQELLDRMNVATSRKEYVFDKQKITELVAKLYNLFSFKIPKIEWCVDITDEKFSGAARAAGATRATRAARAAGATRAAWAAWAAGAAGAAWAAGAARAAGATGAAWAAGATGAARAAWAARAATDYNGQEYIFSYEFCQTNECNENDRKFNKAQELFLQLKEAGAGYLAEKNDIVYICPNPIIFLEENQYHSDQFPAVSWKDGLELYYLDGVNLAKDLWQKIISQKMTFSEIMTIETADQRTVALKYNPQAILNEHAELVHKDNRNNELYKIEGQKINEELGFPKIWFLKMLCPTGRIFIEGCDPIEAEKNPNATYQQALLCGLSIEQYMSLELES